MSDGERKTWGDLYNEIHEKVMAELKEQKPDWGITSIEFESTTCIVRFEHDPKSIAFSHLWCISDFSLENAIYQIETFEKTHFEDK